MQKQPTAPDRALPVVSPFADHDQGRALVNRELYLPRSWAALSPWKRRP
ncbi:hypothetical protein OG930_36260 [Streptomyces sp. NBC_01799]|nr:hypothetical protein OG930_36260 [Streptomyces sp. NBC_01799]